MYSRVVVLLALLGCATPERPDIGAVTRAEAASTPSARLVRWVYQLVVTGNLSGAPWLGREPEGAVITGNPGGGTLWQGREPESAVITGNPGGYTLRPWSLSGSHGRRPGAGAP